MQLMPFPAMCCCALNALASVAIRAYAIACNGLYLALNAHAPVANLLLLFVLMPLLAISYILRLMRLHP